MKQGKEKQVQPTSKKIEEGLSYSVEVRDKEGRVLQRISAPSRSFVQQWNQIVNLQARQETEGVITDRYGTVWTSCDAYSSNLRADAGIGSLYGGLRVGRGSTAVAITDIALESPCDEGTGTDEFNHQANTFTVPVVVGTTCSFTIKRIFVNNSGATITVRELGCETAFYVAMIRKDGLAFRDVLPGAVTVPHGGSITVTYTIAATV
ncbi:hypothetical protein ES703_49665 [subsurface metagenome]